MGMSLSLCTRPPFRTQHKLLYTKCHLNQLLFWAPYDLRQWLEWWRWPPLPFPPKLPSDSQGHIAWPFGNHLGVLCFHTAPAVSYRLNKLLFIWVSESSLFCLVSCYFVFAMGLGPGSGNSWVTGWDSSCALEGPTVSPSSCPAVC